MINIYNKDETNFNNNGLAVLKPNYCYVIEELNGMFHLEMEHEVDLLGKYRHLQNDYIIKAPTPRNSQLFRIYLVQKLLNRTIKVYAKHIFYDLLMNNVNLRLINSRGDNTLRQILTNSEVTTNFITSSDITTQNNIEIENKDPVTAILGDEGFCNIWGGELLRDNYNITVNRNIGENLGFKIIYRKNLTGLDVAENNEDVVTRIKPVARNINDNPLYLPELYINSPNINKYPFPRLHILECTDLQVGRDNMTHSMVLAEMRKRSNNIFLSGGDLPIINCKVEFQLLSQTEQYKDYVMLEKVNLGDIIMVYHEPLGVNLQSKCIKYKYDSVQEKYVKIELGHFRNNMSNLISSVNTNAKITISSIDAGLTNHITNITTHVSQEDKNKWNNYNKSIVDLEKHTGNKEIHVSEKEKKALSELVEGSGIGTDSIKDGVITTEKLADNSVTAPKLANGTITGDKIANDTISVNQIIDTRPTWQYNIITLTQGHVASNDFSVAISVDRFGNVSGHMKIDRSPLTSNFPVTNGWLHIATLPIGFRPLQATLAYGVYVTRTATGLASAYPNVGPFRVHISSSGMVSISPSGTGITSAMNPNSINVSFSFKRA